MEHLPEWLQQRYETLLEAFRDRESFSREEALRTLDVPEGTGGDILSKLESAGYLRRGSDPLDKRVHPYRLVDVSRARDLDEQLEEWRLKGMQSAPPLARAIDRFWERCREALKGYVDLTSVPSQPGLLVEQCVEGRIKLSALRVVRKVNLGHLDKTTQTHAKEILKLFDSSSNAYRSLTNVLLEHKKLDRDLAAGAFDLAVGEYASLDGVPLTPPRRIANKSLCPICRRFRQSQTALALITGNPKMDSLFQTYRNNQSTRSSMRVCGYCFTAGWIDLPVAKITKSGQSVSKGREYLFIATPLTRDDIQRLLDVISNRPSDETDKEIDPELEDFNRLLEEKYGVQGFDSMSVLGLSARRLQEMRGFVLPSANPLLRVVAVRVPVERLVGEDKVSGAVQRELVKATMYDFWQITGGSLHYNRITNDQFSVDGQPIELEDMRRANIAYRIADRYARVGRYRQLNSGLFMLLLARPREAANRILRASHRVRRYAPGREKTKEVIELTEQIARQDWKFDLGLRIVETLVEVGLLKKVQGFRYGPGPNDVFTGVKLVKWLQRLKMIRDETSARAWGNMLINALKRGDVAYKDYIQSQGGQVSAPGKDKIAKILDLVDGENGIIQTCARHGGNLAELSRDLANMDYYLLFYYNQHKATKEETK